MKRIICLLLITSFVFASAGCSLSRSTKKGQIRETVEGEKPGGVEYNILTCLAEERVEVVSVRYYVGTETDRYNFEYAFEVLDKNRVKAFDKTFRNIQFHTVAGGNPGEPDFGPDMSRGDRGIEMLLDNGKYLICDGKRLVQGNDPVDSKEFTFQAGRMCRIQITGCDYWELMKEYFETIE